MLEPGKLQTCCWSTFLVKIATNAFTVVTIACFHQFMECPFTNATVRDKFCTNLSVLTDKTINGLFIPNN